MIGHIHSIETCGTVDGPGMRYVVFFKGCPMRCLYCHNPDTWDGRGGEEHTVDDLLAQYNSLKPFYTNGGITATGGEPLVQIDFLIELFEACKKQGIHTCLDTSGIIFNRSNPELLAKFDRLMKVTDLIMLDIKHIDPEEHKKLTSQPIDNILDFAHYTNEKGVALRIRHVIVPDITYKPEYLERLGRFMAELDNVKQLEVLPYHDMGKKKYEDLGIDYKLKDTKPLTNDDATKAKEIILGAMKSRRQELKNA
jgi:pyruvate formate lyase activating enzyme